jgi:magnesium transporter
MPSQQVRTRVWRNGIPDDAGAPLERLGDVVGRPDTLVWVDLCGPDEAMLRRVADELGLDPHAVEDALTEDERPKVSHSPSQLFLTTTAIWCATTDSTLVATRVSAFALPGALITVRLDDRFDMAAVEQRWDENADLLKFGERALLHGLLDDIVDGYFAVVEILDDGIEAIEDLLFAEDTEDPNALQRRTFALRKSLAQARRTILPMREVVNSVLRRATDGADGSNAELLPYFEDINDHMLRAADWVDSLRDLVSSVIDTNMSLADTRMNLIMKKLTSWAAIVAVPTAVTGYFGQNVPFPGAGSAPGFWASLVLMVVLAVILYVIFRVKDWL